MKIDFLGWTGSECSCRAAGGAGCPPREDIYAGRKGRIAAVGLYLILIQVLVIGSDPIAPSGSFGEF